MIIINKRLYKSIIGISFCIILILLTCACNITVNTTDVKSDVQIAREEVIEKWKNHANNTDTSSYIEERYKKFPSDDIISNIYYYCMACEQYNLYTELNKESHLEAAKKYAQRIDKNYSGEFAEEMHNFVDEVVYNRTSETLNSTTEKEKHNTLSEEDRYKSLTNSEKKAICQYIERRYEYYDSVNGGYSGDKYSDIIMREAASKYNLSVQHIEIIWMNMYSY